jgi:integrase
MATIYFQLERSKTLKDKTHPIYLVIKLKEAGKEKRFRHYTGHTSLRKHWIGEGERKRVSATAPGAGITNARLETLRSGAVAIIANAKNLKDNLTINYFRDRFSREVIGENPEPEVVQSSQLDFFDHLQNFIDNKQSIFQPATLKTYSTLKKSLQQFEKAIGYKVTFESINKIFFTLYTKYLIEDTKVIDNTLAKRIATLKAFLSAMEDQRVNTFTDYKGFKAKRDYETTIMYLTEAELMKLYNLEIANSDVTMRHVRDVFCFAAFTGIRYSDWGRITLDDIVLVNHEGKSVKALKFTMFKVNKTVTIPLNNYALAIIEEYKEYARAHGKLFPVYTNQESNRTLKDIAKAAGINEVVKEIKKSGANKISHINAKHEIISCHDARRTFATLYLERKGRPEVLQKLLGHHSFKETMKYVKVTENAVFEDHVKMNTKRGKVLPFKRSA